jgi:predicted nucleic acid-binding protein
LTVVSDTSPLNYLILIGEAQLLPRLFETVSVPLAVRRELTSEFAPRSVRGWIDSPPAWLEIQAVQPLSIDALVGAGELEAISLAYELRLPLLMDDSVARSVARGLGLDVTGTLGVLERGAAQEIVSLPEVLAKLRATSFYLADSLVEAALERDRLRQEAMGG